MNRALLFLFGLAAACSGKAGAIVTDDPNAAGHVGVESEPAGPFDHPPVDIPPRSRGTRRLSVDMLEGSVPVVAGARADGTPIQWTRTVKGRAVSRFELGEYGAALGRPDYRTTTEEPIEPNALYAKFMDDMARDVCGQMITADAARPEGAEGSLARFAPLDEAGTPAQIGENLRYLKLRFLGQHSADGDDAAVADLRAVYDAAAVDAPREGWRAVCVALFDSPAFHVY